MEEMVTAVVGMAVETERSRGGEVGRWGHLDEMLNSGGEK
jgi:hypothetical protein